ncbi:MAG TPA: recombinase RecA [Gemmataceae bacterium]|jgi:recombination protein RecA|nr:recombinase RecA [Gemmataceae bacterium]
MADNHDKELKNAIAQIEKEYGKGAIMKLGEGGIQEIQGIPTGSISLDVALGGKGLPRGRVVEIYGPEASGKTTVALHAIANAQKAGGVAAFIDAEHALDPSWAKRIGVNLEELLVSQPSCGEEALKIAEMLVKSNAVDIIVIDSVAALVPRNEVEGDIGDSHVGLQARLMSQALRILNPTIARTSTCMVFINQIRQKIGVMFGNPETTSGGLALRFYSSVRLEIRKITGIKDGGEETVGTRVKVKVVKNKVAPPFRNCEFDIMHDRGISYEGDLIDLASEDGLIEKSGAWIIIGETRIQGREKAKEFLRENPAAADELRQKILAKRGLVTPANAAESKDGQALPADEMPAAPRRGRAAAAASE